MKNETYRKKIMGCWLGKAVGGTLGMPYEGMDGPFELDFYNPIPSGMVPNDDLDLQVIWACLLDQQDTPEVSRTLFSKAWKNNIGFPWDEYGVCIRNLREGFEPPLSGAYDNWFVNSMGAAIRSEIWACLAPGNPKLAAAYAYEDACLDHAGQGLWAEVWLAAMESAAFVESDIHRIIQIGFEHIPADAEIRAAIEDTYEWWDRSRDWKKVRQQILEKYGHENFTNVTENMAFILLALLDGDGNFSRSICTANNCGKDTDCTAATVGALLGILNPSGIDERWLKPIGRRLILSREITGITPPDSLDAFTDLVLRLSKRLGEKFPPKFTAAVLPEHKGIPARIGFKEVPWFGQGWPLDVPLELKLPDMKSVMLPGTVATFDSADFEADMMFVEYTIHLGHETNARIFFNTRVNCRVFLEGQYVFGRECGRVAPSAHRIPLNQSIDTTLSAGTHTLTAVLVRPAAGQSLEWIVGIADRDDNNQWVPYAFCTRDEQEKMNQKLCG